MRGGRGGMMRMGLSFTPCARQAAATMPTCALSIIEVSASRCVSSAMLPG